MRSRRLSIGAVMPRYFFHVFDSDACHDHEGKELPNWQAAQVVAILHMGTILQNNAAEISVGDDWHMDVMNETGILLFRLDFSIVRSAILDQISNKYIYLDSNNKDL
ncbi:hypothetical protein EU555_33010 [Methylobacterium nonmethylotrophicum]|uniref:DUF6894 domain-containing protein n=2 Tax=Methylobacterium nonmethylotrophicum TaxID=1141884 RepID=A0A4Z0NFD8_9HYPH|nr:hypothetical protein EU555_33010 [Methylobacterium nonmethylotrophicum]